MSDCAKILDPFYGVFDAIQPRGRLVERPDCHGNQQGTNSVPAAPFDFFQRTFYHHNRRRLP